MQEPRQLLEILDSLEAQNLTLIQSSQEARAVLADSLQKQEATKSRLQADSQALESQVSQLTFQHHELESRCMQLKVPSLPCKSMEGDSTPTPYLKTLLESQELNSK